jgi:stage II sporulation protein D
MRPVSALLVFLAAALAAAPASSGGAAESTTPSVFVLTGHGWGHGVGMSQWGAFGQARAGRSYRQILGHYYRGTTLGRADAARVRVLVATGKRRLAVTSAVPFRVHAAGETFRLKAGRVVVSPKGTIRVRVQKKPRSFRGELRFLPGNGSPLELDGVAYRGSLRIQPADGGLRAVNDVKLEAYLLGVIALESPKEWPLEALKAQAVAARSYALSRRLGSGPFDLYPDWRSQMYGGVAAESPSTTQAVRETTHEVVLYGGSVATTYFYSTSGGRTASAEEVFGTAVPYLVSVEDPWDQASPLHTWVPRQLSPVQLGRLFGLSSPVVDAVAEHAPSGRPTLLRLTTRAGKTIELAATDVRDRLGLRSTWFRIAMLRLGVATPATKVERGSEVELTGVAREVDVPVLERRQPQGGWSRVRKLVVQSDGTFSVAVRPLRSGRYRLTADGFSSQPLSVRVVAGAAGR